MKKIFVTKSVYAIVDDDDFEKVSRWRWGLNYNGYACRRHWNGKGYEKMYMHRFIMDTPNGFDTDHINRDKLDNRRKNLRIVNRSQNNFNSYPSKSNTSGHKGVGFFKPAGLWRAYITIDGVRRDLGYSKDKEGAIALRREAEREYVLFT